MPSFQLLTQTVLNSAPNIFIALFRKTMNLGLASLSTSLKHWMMPIV